VVVEYITCGGFARSATLCGTRLKEAFMDIGKSFTYVFDDKDWVKKVAIGGVVNIVPILSFVNTGYMLRTLKRVSEGNAQPLPEWDDWGGDFVRGLVGSFLAPLIYSLPAILLSILYAIVVAIADASGSSEGVVTLCSTLLTCLTSLWGILMVLWLPAGLIQYAMSGEFGAFFRFGELWAFIRENLSNYIVAILLIIVASLVASLAGGILCGIGVLFTTFWAMLVAAHLLGQVKAASLPPAPAAPASDTTYGDLKTVNLSSAEEDNAPKES